MAAPQPGAGSGESSVRAVRGKGNGRSFIVRLHDAAGWRVCVASLSELLVDHSNTFSRSKEKISSTKPPARTDHGGASTCCQPAKATLTTILDHRRHRSAGRAHCDHCPDCCDLVWTAQFERLGLFNNSAALHLPHGQLVGAFVQRVRVPRNRLLKHRKTLIFHRLNATSGVNYTIIVNPESGPGNDSLPNDDYLPAIQRLNAFPNARTVGYVRTNYTDRPLADVLQDISTYSGWANGSQGIQMHGIFFDEAVHEYSAEAAEYMKEANDAVRAATGLAGEKTVRMMIPPTYWIALLTTATDHPQPRSRPRFRT
jgi:hypothetical protein